MLWFGFDVRADEISVTDGDSIWYRSGGWGPNEDQSIGAVKYRLKGYDAPEIRHRKSVSDDQAEWGRLATIQLKEAIGAARDIWIKPVIFGRWYTVNHPVRLARLIIDGKDAAKIMISAGMAVKAKIEGGHIVRAKWDKMD